MTSGTHIAMAMLKGELEAWHKQQAETPKIMNEESMQMISNLMNQFTQQSQQPQPDQQLNSTWYRIPEHHNQSSLSWIQHSWQWNMPLPPLITQLEWIQQTGQRTPVSLVKAYSLNPSDKLP